MKAMKTSTKLGAAFLAFAAVAPACTSVGSQPARGGVYLVGVAGGG